MGDGDAVERRDEDVVLAGESHRADRLQRHFLGGLFGKLTGLRLLDKTARDRIGGLDDILDLAALLFHHLGADLEQRIADAGDDHDDRQNGQQRKLLSDGDICEEGETSVGGPLVGAPRRRDCGFKAQVLDGHLSFPKMLMMRSDPGFEPEGRGGVMPSGAKIPRSPNPPWPNLHTVNVNERLITETKSAAK